MMFYFPQSLGHFVSHSTFYLSFGIEVLACKHVGLTDIFQVGRLVECVFLRARPEIEPTLIPKLLARFSW